MADDRVEVSTDTQESESGGATENLESPRAAKKGTIESGKTIVVTSGKGGVGKTTASANLGTALALRGHKTVVLDTDIGLRNLDVVMGLENRIVYNLVDVIEGTCKLSQALIRDKHVSDLYLIPAAQTRDKNSIRPDQMKDLCQQLRKDFEYIIIDCPAGIETGFQNAIAAADRAVVVTTPEVSAIRDADRVIGLLESAGLPIPDLVINRIKMGMVQQGDMMDKKDILDLLSVNMLGLVPDDEEIIVSTNRGTPIVHNSKSLSGEAFRRIAARIDGEEVPFLELQNGYGLMSRLKKIFGLNGRS
jgi:septum site-determining protein MinD